jgi:four helix bundle protein
VTGRMGERIKSYKELRVFQESFKLAMEIFELTKKFPSEEKYSLTDQIRRSSRSVSLNIGEAWRKRRYKAAFIAKLSDSETEACETQISLMFASECKYITSEELNTLESRYENVIGMLVRMIDDPDSWTI